MPNCKFLLSGLLFAFLAVASQAGATTYYVDYASGSDSNNGTSKSSPWKTAPGMTTNSGVSASTPLQPGDSVIFKGCVTWPNSVWTWYPKYAGTASAPIYYGVDKSWWDNSVSGCQSSWNRPIFDAQGQSFFSHNNDARMVAAAQHPYATFDNFEFKGYYADGGGAGNSVGLTTDYVDFGSGSNPGIVVENCYFHGWVDAFFSIGTGDVAANSSTITNYVPFSYSPSPSSNWPSSVSPKGGLAIQVYRYWPIQNGGPLVTGISGNGPYTISTNSATQSQACNGCIVQMGIGAGLAIAGGAQGYPCTGCMMSNNVIDGSDTSIVQMNPYPDCGLSEGNNNFCGASVTAAWRQPPTWRNNEIRYFCNGVIGETSEWSGNTIEYLRPCGNPTAHTNIIESTEDVPVNGASLAYNNVIRHTTVQNPNTPTGHWSVGVPFLWGPDSSGDVLYTFNNVMYDTLQNAVWERGSSTGTWYFFNNTADCGPAWSLSYDCMSGLLGNDVIQNNFFVTTNLSPLLLNSGSPKEISLLFQTPTIASLAGLTPAETYAYSPTSSSSPLAGQGTSISSICSAIAAINSDAGAACQSDTTFGVGYNAGNHTVITQNRPTISRPSKPAIGAYEASANNGGSSGGSSGQPSPPAGLQATVN